MSLDIVKQRILENEGKPSKFGSCQTRKCNNYKKVGYYTGGICKQCGNPIKDLSSLKRITSKDKDVEIEVD